MDEIIQFIQQYSFEKYLEIIPKDFTDENYQDFTLHFWENPSSNITKLKAEYEIKQSISVCNILMNNPIQEYYELLNDIWVQDFDLDELLEKYKMPISRLEQLLFPIRYVAQDDLCPYCYENIFTISYKVRQRDFEIKCGHCQRLVSRFIDAEEKQKEVEDIISKKNKFKNDIMQIEQELKMIKCHRCQAELALQASEGSMTYRIKCERCDSEYSSLSAARDEYSEWRQRAVIMLKIKEKERELLTTNLKLRDEEDIKIKSEEIIGAEEAKQAIQILAKIQDQTNEIFNELFNSYIQLSRLDRRIFTIICKECMRMGEKSTWRSGGEYLLDMSEVTYDEPLVYELMKITKMIPIRAVLRRLIKNGLVFCDEEKNTIAVHPILLENIKRLESVNRPQNINQQIAYVIFNKQKYVCHHCGESGRPLKIAYLTVDKNINDLLNLIGICDTCYEDITEDEILVSNIMASLINERNYELGRAWKFLVQFDNSFRESDVSQIEHENLYEEYDENNLIKAYAVSMHKKKNEGFVNEKSFWAYVRGVLRNANGEVNVYPVVQERFKLDKWIEL